MKSQLLERLTQEERKSKSLLGIKGPKTSLEQLR